MQLKTNYDLSCYQKYGRRQAEYYHDSQGNRIYDSTRKEIYALFLKKIKPYFSDHKVSCLSPEAAFSQYHPLLIKPDGTFWEERAVSLASAFSKTLEDPKDLKASQGT